MNGGAEETLHWECTVCGEAVDANFEACWNCQTQRGAHALGRLPQPSAPGHPKEDEGAEEGPWECGSCGAEVSHGDELCPRCGADIREEEIWECEACGAEVTRDDDLCPRCGADIKEVAEEDEELSVEAGQAREPAIGRVTTEKKTMNRPIISDADGPQAQAGE